MLNLILIILIVFVILWLIKLLSTPDKDTIYIVVNGDDMVYSNYWAYTIEDLFKKFILDFASQDEEIIIDYTKDEEGNITFEVIFHDGYKAFYYPKSFNN